MTKCDVCGVESSAVQVCSSSIGGVSFAYCPRCFQSGHEPYSALISMGYFWADINKTYKQQILIPSLNFYGKTKEDFDNDVEAHYRSYIEHLKESQEKIKNDEQDS